MALTMMSVHQSLWTLILQSPCLFLTVDYLVYMYAVLQHLYGWHMRQMQAVHDFVVQVAMFRCDMGRHTKCAADQSRRLRHRNCCYFSQVKMCSASGDHQQLHSETDTISFDYSPPLTAKEADAM